MRTLFTVLILGLASLLALIPTPRSLLALTEAPLITIFGQDQPDDRPIKCGKPCVIEESTGGVVYQFRLQAFDLLAHNTPIIVDGPCASACTLLVDTARQNVCLTTHAVLIFHKGREYDDKGNVVRYIDLQYSPGVRRWIQEQGGLPTEDLLYMPFSEARKFYSVCRGAENG